jgi:uncharacterized membrane protein YgcG
MHAAMVTTMSKRAATLAIASMLTVGFMLTVAGPAWAQFEQIDRYLVSIVIESNGTLIVHEQITYEFGSSPHHGIFRDIPVVYRYDKTHDRIYRLHVQSVSASGGAPAQYTVARQGADDEIKIGDPDKTITGKHTYALAYTVEGALNAFPDHDELFWNAIGTEWSVDIANATTDVSAPGPITQVACFAGSQGSRLPCDEQSFDESGTARFGQSALGPFQGMTVVVGITKGAINPPPKPILVEKWSLQRAFTLNPATVGIASVLLLGFAALFGRLAWRTGRDHRYIGSPVDVAFGSGKAFGDQRQQPEQAVPLFEQSEFPIEFEPPDRIRPGEVGTLIDEVAGPLDVSATIVDLAVRGYLTIEEIPKHGLFGKPDWRLTMVKQTDDSLKAYESKLLTSLFEDATAEGPSGESVVLMSQLRTKFSKRLLSVENELYDDAVKQGWFRARPDKVRARWKAYAWVVIVAGGILEYFAIKSTKWALIPAVIIVAGLVMLFAAKRMPARTAKGTGVLRRTLAFRSFVSEGTEAAKAKFAERQNLFSEYLPYAIVFGVTEKWAKVFERLTDRPPDTSWYISPYAFNYVAFSSSMDHFATTTSGTIASTPAGSGSSGFSGGGFSGGGGGGGGGGSW